MRGRDFLARGWENFARGWERFARGWENFVRGWKTLFTIHYTLYFRHAVPPQRWEVRVVFGFAYYLYGARTREDIL